MRNYLAQPYYGENKIRFYTVNTPIASTPFYTLDLTSDITATWGAGNGPNNVVIYKNKIFVSFDLNGKGGVLIYNYGDIYPVKNANPPIKIKPGGGNGLSSIGIAIDPKTGDLYIPVFSFNGSGSGIYKYTAASNYTIGSQFSSFADPSVAEICANLAFDTNGNLWMTTWSPDNDPTHHFLICYKGLNKNNFYKIINTPTKAYTATATTSATIAVHLLSAPEGIAFDRGGNLWLGNNNDFARTNNAGEGTLVKINKAWLDTLLASPATGAGGPDYTVPTASVDIKYIPSGKLGGLTIDENILYINDQGQNQGSNFTASGTVWKWDVTTPFNDTNFKPSGIFTTYPGNGGSALVEPFLVIRDNLTDTGSEPNVTTTAAWESRDIWVRQSNDGKTAGNDISQAVLGGQLSYVYVRIRNQGIIPTSGDEIIKLYWAKASTGLGWPAPWDGSNNSLLPIKGKPIDPVTGTAIGVILPGQTSIIEIPWTDTPNPKDYSATFGTDDEHFCLLARLETSTTSPFGMSYPEGSGATQNVLIQNVLNNSKIAWRNIHITKVVAKIKPGGIILANYSSVKMNAKLTFELLNNEGNPLRLGSNRLILGARGNALEKLNQTDFNRDFVQVLEDGKFNILNIENGVENIILQPGEILPLTVEYLPTEKTEGYVLRVKQFAEEKGAIILIGGQTFVDGKVKGFPVEIISEKETNDQKKKLPYWLWILILLLVLLILGFLLINLF